MDEINYLQWMRVVNFDNDLLIAEYASILGLNFEENHFYETLIHPIEEIPGSSGMWKIQFSGFMKRDKDQISLRIMFWIFNHSFIQFPKKHQFVTSDLHFLWILRSSKFFWIPHQRNTFFSSPPSFVILSRPSLVFFIHQSIYHLFNIKVICPSSKPTFHCLLIQNFFDFSHHQILCHHNQFSNPLLVPW